MRINSEEQRMGEGREAEREECQSRNAKKPESAQTEAQEEKVNFSDHPLPYRAQSELGINNLAAPQNLCRRRFVESTHPRGLGIREAAFPGEKRGGGGGGRGRPGLKAPGAGHTSSACGHRHYWARHHLPLELHSTREKSRGWSRKGAAIPNPPPRIPGALATLTSSYFWYV